MKLMITSIGSLVGQNILDVLESPLCNRRQLVKIIGTNSISINPQNFRCDVAYQVPATNDASFEGRLLEIVHKECPDVILSGRDEDTEKVAKIILAHSELSVKLPYGKIDTVCAALKKDLSWDFCQKHDLPFAASYVIGRDGGLDGLKDFIGEFGYPLISKPIEGFASKGVFYVRDWKDAEFLSHYEGYMFQEYLGDGDALEGYFGMMDGPPPLFMSSPGIFHHSCHTVMRPDGTYDPFFISRNEHDNGVTVGFRRVSHSELESLANRYAEAVIADGGFGPMTVQFRQNKGGEWKAQEMNMRTNGNTYPRFMMGQDDLGLIVDYLFPEMGFPVYRAPEATQLNIVGKTLTSYMMMPSQMDALKNYGRWNPSE